jgi:magnesium-transporting ATPase (P-type)
MADTNTDCEKLSVPEVLKQLGVDPKSGLSADEAKRRLAQYGPNALEEKKKSELAVLLGFFWGPIPWMIEAAALMALLVKDWGDFVIIVALLLFNAGLGFWEEHAASNALAALKGALAQKAKALRAGQWGEVDAATLVPALPWNLIGWVWVYNLAWMGLQDLVKVGVHRELDRRASGATRFLSRLQAHLHPQGQLHQG